ncbi:Smr/MutS family protein [Portibacter marinus]|uniref:Smr/MutS family protein n=1 Tax=Portibacter marinus TaxID=2898660 RepID=UPI001F1A66C3|nr:Smr/MutS family protein [Portibacter marinus]
MIDINDLWIGDLLRLKRSGRIGRYQGESDDGRLRVKVGEKMILVRPQNLESVKESEHDEKLKQLKQNELEVKLSGRSLVPQIDLHIEKLNPSLVNALPERIADFQVKAFEEYMDEILRSHFKFITIIHGKGTGVLRAHIHSYLNTMDEVNAFHLINNDGATEVILK